MRSIRAELVLWLMGGMLLLTIAAGVGLYRYMEEVLEHSLDAALAAKAEAIAGAVHMEDDGNPHLQLTDAGNSTATRPEGPFYFQIWRDDGSTLARVVPPSMTQEPLPQTTNPRKRFVDARMPDKTTARITQLAFVAQSDEDQFDAPRAPSQRSPAQLVMVVAHDRRSIDGPLAVLLSGLLVAAALMTIGIVLVVTWGVRRGLKPLAQVSALADRIGPDSLDLRFPGADRLPPELLPIGLKLNNLVDRLTAAFARERRFSAAVAHELRTPLAELRSACDVALRWPDDAEGLSIALSEARDVTIQMSTLVQTLLSLARQHAGIEPSTRKEAVNLASAIADAWPQLNKVALERQLKVQQDVDHAAAVATDPTLLTVVLRNLLENATEYTPVGGCVAVRTDRSSDGRWTLCITNTCAGLTSADVSRLFEPFWRSQPSRSENRHAGLGLTLVQAYCEAMNIAVEASLVSPETLELRLQLPMPQTQSGSVESC